MISFVWPPGAAMFAGTGGSETYTAGHVKELLRRGIEAQVVTLGHGTNDGRRDFREIPFLALKNEGQISKLPGTIVFVNKAYAVPTKNKSVIILHCVTPSKKSQKQMQASIVGKTVVATSIYSGQQWALYLDIPYSRIHIVLPFADPIFGNVKRPKSSKKTRIVYAGRLHPDKGIYTLLEMLHEHRVRANKYSLSIVMAGQHVKIGRIIANMLNNYPYAKLLEPVKSVQAMAQLLAKNDVLIMPSVFAEPFGMLSVEAQHAGCKVVASNVGGIPETNCGLLALIEARDPKALLAGIELAVALGPVPKKERYLAKQSITLSESVDAFIKVVQI